VQGLNSVGERAFADVVEARAVIDRDPQAGAALIARSLTATVDRPDSDTESIKARSYAELTLAVDAARRGAWHDALARLADGAHAPVPPGCVLGVAVDNTRALAVVRVDVGFPGARARRARRRDRGRDQRARPR
jgi:hypothetical protein